MSTWLIKRFRAASLTAGLAIFSFFIPVRNLQKWNSAKQLLRNTLATLTGDNVQFHFVKLRPEENNKSAFKKQISGGEFQSDCVCLFSGGLDSFAGAAYLIGQGRRPLFVSHQANGVLRILQSNLITEIKNQSGCNIEHFQYRVTSKKVRDSKYVFKARESSHRARSFMFLGFAAIAAALRGLTDIYICERWGSRFECPDLGSAKGQ